MAKNQLTTAAVERMRKPKSGRIEISDAEPGLFLWVTPRLLSMSFRKPFKAIPIKEAKAHRRRRLRERASARISAWGPVQFLLVVLGISIGVLLGVGGLHWMNAEAEAQAASFICSSPQITDGDTLRCGSNRVRLAGIDAPELPGHCRQGRKCAPGDPYASTENLRRLVGGATLNCTQTDIDHYGRTVARCSAGETDLSCAQLRDGHAIRRYGFIWC